MKPSTLSASLLCCCLLASCATMQSHKNVRLSGIRFEGQELSQPSLVYLSQGRWFVAAQQFQLKKVYPIIDDTIFLEQELPSYVKQGPPSATVYLPLSAGTAKVLRDPQGYAALPVLLKEIQSSQAAPVASLPHAQSFPVRAQFAPHSGDCILCNDQMSHEPTVLNRTLAGLDLVFVDAPGTLVYNVAIPFMAPYYFFKNVIRDNKKDPFDQ